MIDANFIEALNHSINRINAGDSVADCLQAYSQYAVRLEALLETGQLVRRAMVDSGEAVAARERQRLRFEGVLENSRSSRRSFSRNALVRLVASIALVLMLLAGGAGILAESSLPGDPLYGVKLWTESLRLALTDNDPNLQATFESRRVEEARGLVQTRRTAEMTLTGTVDAALTDGLVIDGLTVMAENERITPGSRVEVDVRSTDEGELIALQIRVLDEPPDSRPPTITPEPSPVPQQTQRATPTASPPSRPRPSATATPIRGSTRVQPRTAAPTTTTRGSRPDAGTACETPPTRWVRYVIQPGDTLSALAGATDSTPSEIAAANCLTDVRHIIAGQIIFLPSLPTRTARPQDTSTRSALPTPADSPDPTQPSDGDGQRGTDGRGQG